MNQFRIGACYRQRNGEVVRVVSEEAYTGRHCSFHPTGKVLLTTCGGWRRIHDGAACNFFGEKLEELSLLPGEVDEHGNPISEHKAESAKNEEVARAVARMSEKAKHAPLHTEKKRPPLTWAEPKPFDPFKGMQFEVRHDAYSSEEEAMYIPQGPLQKLADTSSALVSPNFGSAHLKG